MAGILQGAGGSAGNLEEDERLKGILSQYGGGEAYKNLVEGGSSGNASAALATYLTNPLLNVETSYDTEYTPYKPDPIKVDGDGESGSSEGDEEYDDLLTPSGTPMPGHPDYEAYMIAGGEGVTSDQPMPTESIFGKGYFDSPVPSLLSVFGKKTKVPDYVAKAQALANKKAVEKEAVAKEIAKQKTIDAYNQFAQSQPTNEAGGDAGDYGGQSGAANQSDAATGNYADNPDFMNIGGPVEYKRLGGVADPYGMTYKRLKIAMPKKYGPLRTSKIQTKRGGSGVLGQAGKMATGMALKSLLGPLGALFASQGGPVGNPKYMGHGGPLGEKPMTKLEMANDMHNHKKNIMTLKTLADQGLKTEAHKIKSRSKIL